MLVRAAQVLLEHIMMLELIARGEVKGIYPVMVGERTADGQYAKFFEGKATVSLPPVRVAAVGEKLSHHLRRAKKGEPQSREAASATVPRVLAGLLEYQGTALENDDDAALGAVAQAVAQAIYDLRAGLAPQRSRKSGKLSLGGSLRLSLGKLPSPFRRSSPPS